jgi:DNA ligase-1
MPNLIKLMKSDKVTTENIHQLRYPLLASPKLDGIRAFNQPDGKLYSYNGKLIRNRHTQTLISHEAFIGFDGELIVGEPTDSQCFNTTTRGVMSGDGRPDVTFHVFDWWWGDGDERGFTERLQKLRAAVRGLLDIKLVQHITVKNHEELIRYEEVCVTKGYEGVMLRHPHGPYKHGRSTFNEGWLLKMKRFDDSEAVIIDMVELRHNHNEKDASGKRTNHAAGKSAGGVLGALVVRDLKTGVEFEVGTGFTQAERVQLWEERLLDRVITYRFFPVGVKDRPRHPVFKGFREDV